jgi:hypothetical protein
LQAPEVSQETLASVNYHRPFRVWQVIVSITEQYSAKISRSAVKIRPANQKYVTQTYLFKTIVPPEIIITKLNAATEAPDGLCKDW